MTDFGFKLDAEYEGIDVEDGWQHHRWTCRLIHQGGTITTPYRMGMAHDGVEPTVHDLLECLQRDAQVEVYDEYDDVLCDLPYHKARKITDACKKTADDLRRILGDDFDDFMAHNFDEDGDD